MVAYGIPNCCSHNLQLTPTAEQCIQCTHTHTYTCITYEHSWIQESVQSHTQFKIRSGSPGV